MASCKDLERLNALGLPGQVHQFPPFKKDFVLTDVVLDLWSFPKPDASALCSIWLVVPGTSEILFNLTVDRLGRRLHLQSGVLCPAGSHLTANVGVNAAGGTPDVRVLITGAHC
jgi:hypothetical protein